MTAALVLAATACAVAGAFELLATLRPRAPRLSLLVRLGARLGVEPSGGLAARVAAAGIDRPVREVVALQAGMGLTAAVAALPLATSAPGRLGVAIFLGGPVAGYVLPDLGLRRRIARRRRAMEHELPDVLDLLRVAVAAGLAPRRALAEVGRRHAGELARELRRTAARAAIGEPIERALDDLEKRCPAQGVPALVAALRRAERHGTPLTTTLAALALQARSLRAARRSELAARASPKIQLVVALLLVPAVLMLVAAAMLPTLIRG
jgi:tight adherence protein C